MARGRMLNITVASDIRLNELSLEAHWAYMMAIPHLDRDGIMLGHPKIVAGRICPLRPKIGAKMEHIIQEWIVAGLVINYDSSNGPLLYFTGFQKNQNLGAGYIKEGKSAFAPPPGYIRTSTGLIPQENEQENSNSGVTPEQLPTNSGISPREVEVEVEVEDKEEEREAAPPALPELPPKQPTPQQELFGAICEALGWDYHVISDKNKGQVAQAAGILAKANYTVEDIRRFMVEVWFKDWRWLDKQSYPTLAQLREEIGKTRSLIPGVAPPKKRTSLDKFKEIARNQGTPL